MTERQYQRRLIGRIKEMFPGCDVMLQDPRQRQGVPDLLILYRNTWAMLEVKIDDTSPVQPNQEHYVEKYNGMSFAAFINPLNEEEVLGDLQRSFGLAGSARLS